MKLIVLPAILLVAFASANQLQKRQVYYLCGTYPNQYYSTVPCNSNPSCPNGGQKIGVGCTTSAQCTPYYNGVSTCIAGCCCTVPQATTAPSLRFGFCPSGQQSEVRCSGRNQCPSGHTCMSGLCCSNTGNEWNQACGGQAALASCSAGSCAAGSVCTASNYCCECAVGTSGGVCRTGTPCPSGYSCSATGYCCASCPNGEMPFGQCVNGRCGGGRTCRAGNICC